MYEYFRGKLIEKKATGVILEIGGIGYEIFLPSRSLRELALVGEEYLLYIALVVKEHTRELFGFLTKQEKNLFEKLLSFSGIGPKTAITILGHLDEQTLFEATRSFDVKKLTKIPGIGKKTAEKLLIELKGLLHPKEDVYPFFSLKKGSVEEDAFLALCKLGYDKEESEALLQKALSELPQSSDLSQLIQKALQNSGS